MPKLEYEVKDRHDGKWYPAYISTGEIENGKVKVEWQATGFESWVEPERIRIRNSPSQEDVLPCGHSADNLVGFGGANPNGSCLVCELLKTLKTMKEITYVLGAGVGKITPPDDFFGKWNDTEVYANFLLANFSKKKDVP